jgi:hypothetical protein
LNGSLCTLREFAHRAHPASQHRSIDPGSVAMLAIKPAIALLFLGVGGLLGINEVPKPVLLAPLQLQATTADVAPAPELPDFATLRTSVHAALAAQVRADLDDDQVQVTLAPLDVQRASLRTLELRGTGEATLAASGAMPLDVVAVYDLVDHRLERVDYTARPATAASPVSDGRIRKALSDRIDARVAADFRDQPAHFRLLSVERVDYGRNRLRLEGAGLTDFGAEGVVYTPFVAILDKRDGTLVELTYDLLAEAPADHALASR